MVRDLLTSWAWALCMAAERAGGLADVPVINLFDEPQCSSLAKLERVLATAGRGIARARLEAEWFGEKCSGHHASGHPTEVCGAVRKRR